MDNKLFNKEDVLTNLTAERGCGGFGSSGRWSFFSKIADFYQKDTDLPVMTWHLQLLIKDIAIKASFADLINLNTKTSCIA